MQCADELGSEYIGLELELSSYFIIFALLSNILKLADNGFFFSSSISFHVQLDRIEDALHFLNVISFLSHLLPVSKWFGNPSSTSPLKRSSTFLHNFQNALCKFSSNSNQGKVSSHFLLYLLILDPALEGGLEVELEQCFLGGLGCTSISLELETSEDLDALLKYERISIFIFCFSVLQFIYHSI